MIESKVDPTTWGNQRACIVLADKLNKIADIKLNRHVHKIFQDYFSLTSAIKDVKEMHRYTIVNILHKHYTERIKSDERVPKELKTYICNILKTQGKKYAKFTVDKTVKEEKNNVDEWVKDSLGNSIKISDIPVFNSGDLVETKCSKEQFIVGYTEWEDGLQLIWDEKCPPKDDDYFVNYATPSSNLILIKRKE